MIHIIHGQDLFRKQLRIAALKAEHLEPGMEALNLVHAENPSLIDFVSLINTPAFGFGKKIIQIKNFTYLENKAEDAEVSSILEGLADLPESNIIIFDSEKVSGVIKLVKQLKNLPGVELEEAKPFNSWEAKPAAGWLRYIFPLLLKELDSKMPMPGPDILEYFAEQTGVEDSSKLYSELKKLIILGKPFTEALIDQECQARHDVFKFARLLAEAKVAQANKELEKIIVAKELHLGVLAMLDTIISKYLKLKLALQERKSDADIAQLLSASPQSLFHKKKEVANMQESHLDALLEKIVDLEFKVKTGRTTIDRGFRLLVNS